MIDFSFPPEVEEIRLKVRAFMDDVVRPEWEAIDQGQRGEVIKAIVKLRRMPARTGASGCRTCRRSGAAWASGPTAMAAVSAEAAKVGIGPFVLNAQAPDEGNQHTLEHWGTPSRRRSTSGRCARARPAPASP